MAASRASVLPPFDQPVTRTLSPPTLNADAWSGSTSLLSATRLTNDSRWGTASMLRSHTTSGQLPRSNGIRVRPVLPPGLPNTKKPSRLKPVSCNPT